MSADARADALLRRAWRYGLPKPRNDSEEQEHRTFMHALEQMIRVSPAERATASHMLTHEIFVAHAERCPHTSAPTSSGIANQLSRGGSPIVAIPVATPVVTPLKTRSAPSLKEEMA